MNRRLITTIVSTHLVLLLISFLFSLKTPRKVLIKTIKVHEHIIEAPKPQIKTISQPKTPKTKQKKQKKKKSKKKPSKKPATKNKSTKSTKRQKLLKDLEKSLAKIESSQNQISFNTKCTVPKFVTLQTKAPMSSDEKLIIAHFFQDNLTLPEKGDVVLTISVQPNGKIANITSVSSASRMNETYLKETLKGIHIPHTFKDEVHLTVTFRGDL